MDTDEIARRVLVQRTSRYTDAGPPLGAAGSARFRIESGRVRVAYANPRPGMERELVAAVQRFARMRRSEAQWTVVPQRAGEADLPAALLAAGFRVSEDLLLMAHAGRIPAAASLPAPVSTPVAIGRITTWQQMWEYEYGSRQCFYDDPYPSHATVTQRAGERWRELERGWCRYYGAWLNGRLVGGCYVSQYEDVPTVMGVYTLPDARRKGIAGALVVRCVAETITPGNEEVCLFVEHGNPAENLYRGLGFVPLVDSRTYTWSPWERGAE